MLNSFLTSRLASGCSPRTVTWYEQMISRFLSWMDQAGVSWPPGPEDVESFLSDERRSGLSPSTVAGRYRALSAWFSWLVARGHLPGSPMDHVARPRVPRRIPRRVEVGQLAKLLETIPQDGTWVDARDRLILLLLFWTGLRLAELAALEVRDLDSSRRLVRVRAGKGGRDRFVPYPVEIGPALLSYLMARPPWSGPELFLSSDGGRAGGRVRGVLTDNGIRQMIRRRCQRAGVPYVNPHAFRHGLAMALLNSGEADLSLVARILGHSSTSITQRFYAQWTDDGMRSKYDRAARAIAEADD